MTDTLLPQIAAHLITLSNSYLVTHDDHDTEIVIDGQVVVVNWSYSRTYGEVYINLVSLPDDTYLTRTEMNNLEKMIDRELITD